MSIQLMLDNQRVAPCRRWGGLGDAMRAFVSVVFIFALTVYVCFEAGRMFERYATPVVRTVSAAKQEPLMAKLDGFDRVTLATLGRGALQELFDPELIRVVENIRDVNTDWRKRRRIVVTIDFAAADDKREQINVAMSAKSTIVSPFGAGTAIYVGIDQGELVALESTATQMPLFKDPEPTSGPSGIVQGGK